LRERLKAALLDLCEERGYAAVEVEDVTRRAGVEPSDWTRLYGDLEGCACEMLDEIRDEFVRVVATAALQHDRWRDQMRAAAYSMLNWCLADIPRTRFVMIESWGIGERAVLIREEGMDAMISLIDIGRSELEDPESLTRATAQAVAGTVFSHIRQILASGPDPDVATDMVPQLMHTVVLPYIGEAAALEELSIPAPKQTGTQA
jgi:AcrR family transcriptional regulator